MDGTSVTKKTPVDFDKVAELHNHRVAGNAEARQQVQREADALSAVRDGFIADAKTYGLTAAYARTLLRKP